MDYIQFLKIDQALQAMKVAQNAKIWSPNCQKNEMLIFGLHSTSEDQLSILSDESCLKCEKNSLLSVCNTKKESFSVAFMFSPIYLRL